MERIRQIGNGDIADAVRLSTEAGWNQLPEDWSRLFDGMPRWCYGMEADGTIAAATTAWVYPGLAWIGMVLTLPAFRGRGFARRVLEKLLDELPVPLSRLDATDMGRPLYTKLGYEDEYAVERWIRTPSPPLPRVDLPPFTPELCALDREAFGYDRSALLTRLAGDGGTWSTANGFAMTRAGRNARFFGPCVAANDEDARLLLQAFLGEYAQEPVFWDLTEDKAEFAREFGFTPVRRLIRMRRGAADHTTAPARQVYALAGFEFG